MLINSVAFARDFDDIWNDFVNKEMKTGRFHAAITCPKEFVKRHKEECAKRKVKRVP